MFRFINKSRPSQRRRGAAMTEMVLVIPILLVVVAYVFYFGRGVVRVQHARGMARYEAWREAAQAPGPWGNNPDFDQRDDSPLLNQTFYANNAQRVAETGGRWFPMDAPDELIDRAAQFSGDTSDLVDEAIDAFPRGRTVRVHVDHEETIPLWQPFAGTIRHRHTRLGNDWKHANGWAKDELGEWVHSGGGPWITPQVRDAFLEDLDGGLESLANQDNELARMVRNIYLARPGYGGPTIDISPP